MRILIAIVACHKRYQYCAYQRGSWISELPKGTLSRFFFGRGGTNPRPFYMADEIDLPVPDDYGNLILKVRAIFEWAYQEGYDYVLKCDDDTYLFPDRFLKSGFQRWDYIGQSRVLDGLGRGICSGGCYGLSRKALKVLIESPRELMYKPRHLNLISGALWQEDRWVAEVLQKNGIQPHNDPRFTQRRKETGSEIAVWEYPGFEMVRKHRRHYPLGFEFKYREF